MNAPIPIDSVLPVSLRVLSGGRLALDGGNMFGPVPRVLWETKLRPDHHHRIGMDTNCVLVEMEGHRILIDTGYGSKAGTKQREFQGLEEGEPIARSLAAIGLTPDDISIVILTHLHFDHVGGCTRRSLSGALEPVFPRAQHFVQSIEWEDAAARKPELLGSFFEEDFLPLEEAGLVEKVGPVAEILPGLTLRLVGGHTRGMQIVEIGRRPGGVPAAVCLADLAPTVHHLRTFWHVSYDQFPLDVRRAKPVVLGKVADEGSLVLFCHDVAIRQAYLKRDPKQEFIAEPA